MNDTPLPKTGYLAFDALSMKAFLKQRLTDNGVFSDQIFEGSNLAQIIDVFAMTFQNLIFYMNKTGSEGLFSDAQIYENLNRIVKSLGYNPVGLQTALVPIQMKASELLDEKTYVLPRYSFCQINGHDYSTATDFIFSPKETNVDGFLNGIRDPQILYQGKYQEYKEYKAQGNDYETFIVNPGEGVLIDHYNIHVYIKRADTGKWVQSERTQSLYLCNAGDIAHECRLNEDKLYELKFGNDICGRKLQDGDIVQVYYLQSDGAVGQVSPGNADGLSLTPFQTDRYEEIMADVRNSTEGEIIDNANAGYISVYNESPSTFYSETENVENIRENAPHSFRAQYRLVTANDFESFIKTNYRNIVQSTKVMNNWEYIQTYIRYLHTVGLSKPSSDTRMALNQFNFADACNFNNVYIFAVPTIINESTNYNYISNELKSMIIKDMLPYKTLTCEPVVVDPVYVGFKLGIQENGKIPTQEDCERTMLIVEKSPSSIRSSSDIKNEVIAKIKDFFSVKNNKIGEMVSINELGQEVCGINGISKITTQKTQKDGSVTTINGLSFIVLNDIYPEIATASTSDFQLEPFMFPYYHDIKAIGNHIKVINRHANATIEY